jgi:hypothetical protein
LGGIPALDQQLRPDVYNQGGPQQVNQQAESNLAEQGIPSWAYDGSYYQQIAPPVAAQPTAVPVEPNAAQSAPPSTDQTNGGQTSGSPPPPDTGIVPSTEGSPPVATAVATEGPPLPSDVGTGGAEGSPTPEGDMGILPSG